MRSTYLSLYVHVIFSTKNREPFLTDDIRQRTFDYLGGTIGGLGALSVRVGGMPDHVHLLIRTNAKTSISDLVREIKKSSTNWIRNEVPSFSWQEGYGAFSVSAERLRGVVKYIENQEERHHKMTFEEERIMLFRLAGIEFEPDDLD